ncbi:hypothetical protein PanWU01x14_221040 [Parasponia andersonii]|uniref:Uncharacterized protein n=1 Tax=Parasponia andersonii TaxID=3476 RepID=A0A2P5BPL4_PARAD|nr:hypothetical protein PanWU01x14_221040 [Parasponia andersonii]
MFILIQIKIITRKSSNFQVLSRFEGFPTKKLEALRTLAALYRKLDSIINELENWKIGGPIGQLLDKLERYFKKEMREAKEGEEKSKRYREGPKKGTSGKILWRAFQFAFRVYTFAGGHDDRADDSHHH